MTPKNVGKDGVVGAIYEKYLHLKSMENVFSPGTDLIDRFFESPQDATGNIFWKIAWNFFSKFDWNCLRIEVFGNNKLADILEPHNRINFSSFTEEFWNLTIIWYILYISMFRTAIVNISKFQTTRTWPFFGALLFFVFQSPSLRFWFPITQIWAW